MKTLYKLTIAAALMISGATAQAQLNPNGAQYYNNRYLSNPAFAGSIEGFNLSGGYRSLFNNIPGAPVSQSLTGDYGFNKVGLGLNLSNESAGLLRQTRVVATYAYRINLDSRGSKLNFGLSGGFMSQRLEQSDISGNVNDPMIGNYNSRKTYIDGDFGMAYTSNSLTIQAAIPNMKSFFKRDVIKLADEATFYSAVSYKFNFGKGMGAVGLEPLVAFRGVRGFDNIWDAGALLGVADQQIQFTGLYHSTGSATMGVGLNFKKKYLISGLYTSQTSDLSGYTNGSFELNLKIAFGK